jgi:hypothetical protein
MLLLDVEKVCQREEQQLPGEGVETKLFNPEPAKRRWRMCAESLNKNLG